MNTPPAKFKMPKGTWAAIIAGIAAVVSALIARPGASTTNVSPTIDTQSNRGIQQSNSNGPNQIGGINYNSTPNGK